MIVESIDELNPAGGKERVVIVGGGTVGLYLAAQLCKQGREVLVIESGNQSLGNFSPATFGSVGLPHEGIRNGRSKSLGGTSNLWGGQLVEYQRADFCGRDWLPDSKWPLDYDEIAPYYRPTYENLGIPAKFIHDADVFRELQVQPPDFASGVEIFLTRWLQTPSLAAMFDSEIQKDANFKTLINHTVVGFQGDQGRLSHAEVVDPQGRTHSLEGSSFILASGTIEIVRLMLHAATSPAWNCPWKDNENLGAYFQDHIGGRAAEVCPIDRKRFLGLFSTIVRAGFKFQPKLRLTTEVLASEQILNMQGMLYFESSISENLVFLKQFLKAAVYSRRVSGVGQLFKNLVACGRYLPPLMWRYVVQNRVFVPSGSKISFMLQSEQMPVSKSRISIDPSVKDPWGLPKVILDWHIGDEELQSMRDFTLRCKAALETAGLAELRVVEDLMELNPGYLKKVRDNYHHVGGACMGESAADGVVDKNLQVFGTDNLYVLGASTFRTASNANTTFLALSFATRLAERLLSKN